MRTAHQDPLLTFAKLATIVVRVVLVVAMIAIGIAMAAAAIAAAGYLPDDVSVEFAPTLRDGTIWIAVLAMLAALFALGLTYDFVVRLAQIIDTVGQGDPFVMDNAARLTRMAWLALGVQLLGIVMAIVATWAGSRLDEGVFNIQADVSFTGVGLAIVLFILARVFRKGAEMREELEGTV
jgi:hypothetical protein